MNSETHTEEPYRFTKLHYAIELEAWMPRECVRATDGS